MWERVGSVTEWLVQTSKTKSKDLFKLSESYILHNLPLHYR